MAGHAELFVFIHFNFYKMDKFDLQEMMDIFNALKNGTQPKPGEDYASIMDCWNFLEAHLITAKKEIEQSRDNFSPQPDWHAALSS